jgi:hypothetical protein
VAALVLYQWCGSPERGDGLPLIRSGGGRALHGHQHYAGITYLVSRLWRIKDTGDYRFVTIA